MDAPVEAETESTAAALPEPLSLDHALSLAQEPHPDLQAAAAETDIALAQRDRARAAYGVNAGVNAAARWIEPADYAFDQSHNDAQASLVLSKRLYDFGRTRANVAAADATLSGRQLRYADTQTQRSLNILERYLDVLLADLRFRVEDEAMAIAYVRVDRARDRHELGQISEIALLAAETQYQETRSARYAAQAQQRTRRVALAETLNRPGQLSNTLEEPALDTIALEPPALEKTVAEILHDNPRLRALRAETEAARERIQAARAADRPVVSGRAEASEYQRQTGSTDPWAVGVQVEIPLYTGGRSSAERAQARAELTRSEAELARAELELRESAHTLWEEIEVLRASREEAQTRIDYRELYLDRSRTLYEMEVNSDLGDAMVVSSQARLRQAELDYRLLLDWARLNALRGRPLFAHIAAEEADTP
ncbi:MAG: TolC family protein [Gammaproteobacteria bacterium]|nr:TolC family protein [Gammaproteobacteria bacterium]